MRSFNTACIKNISICLQRSINGLRDEKGDLKSRTSFFPSKIMYCFLPWFMLGFNLARINDEFFTCMILHIP